MTAAMPGGFAVAVAWPLLAALVLMLLPPRTAVRTVGRVATIASLIALGLASVEALPHARPPGWNAGSLWLDDRLALALPVLLAVPGVVANGWLLGRTPSMQDVTGRRWRHPLVALQVLTAGALDAARADPLFLMLAGLALVAAAMAMLAPPRQFGGRVAILGALLLTAWLGIAMLAAGLGLPVSWTRLATDMATIPPALRLFGQLLLMLPMLLLAWLGPASALQPPATGPDLNRTAGATAAHALLPLLPSLPALIVTLRLRALPEPDPTLLRLDMLVLTGAGLSMLLLGMLLLPAQRRLADRIVTVGAMHLGAAAIGFGVGGTVGVAAGLLILSFLGLGLPLAWLPAISGASGWIRRVAILSLAGLPPFGPFAAMFMLLLRLFGELPVLAVLVLAAFCAGAVTLLSTPRPDPGVDLPTRLPYLLPAVAVLLLLATCGIAMPGPVSDWLLGIGESMAGATWPAASSPHQGAAS